LRKSSFATMCSLGLLLVVLLTGCGGGGHPSAKSSVDGKAACAKVKVANAHYRLAIARMGLKFSNKPLGAKAQAATREFRETSEQLQRVSSSSEKKQLAQLVLALSHQEKVLMAFAANNFAAAVPYGKGLNAALYQSIANLSKICPGIPPNVFTVAP
jgi:hypothetical protein